MKYYAVFDTNVLVSAMITHNSDSATVRVMEQVVKGRVIPLFNDEILLEYQEVLQRSKFNLREEDVLNMLDLFVDNGCWAGREATDIPFPDADDIVFFEVAMSKEDAYLITGNIRHFPKTPKVVTPAEMLEIMGM
ncbi:MAG: putative toxin-antitoxin system toxin component, PIN family [Bacteroidales bacterium]|nr:putative toxin-antitoxin system toxin component, PIN family [Bacteroidales bacterium]